MPARAPKISAKLERVLQGLGAELRDHRKKLKVSAVATAEAAGISRITLHRIERGEPSVAMSAYLSVIVALGLSLELLDQKAKRERRLALDIPKKIRIGDYPQLKNIAWQVKSTKQISPKEALDFYERNWRHVDTKAMEPREREFLSALLAAFGRERLLV